MGMPTVLTQNGTGTTAIWFPDWAQTPFSVSYIVAANTTGTTILQATFDNIDISSSLGGPASVTSGAATWVTVAGPVAATVTGVISSPVRALQISLISSSSTGACTATFIQATFSR